jgi:hypothetical protein
LTDTRPANRKKSNDLAAERSGCAIRHSRGSGIPEVRTATRACAFVAAAAGLAAELDETQESCARDKTRLAVVQALGRKLFRPAASRFEPTLKTTGARVLYRRVRST